MATSSRSLFTPAFSFSPYIRHHSPPVILPLSSINRRTSLLILLPVFVPYPAVASTSDGGDLLERYTDQSEGFTLLIPPSWTKVEKAGATALFQEGKNNIGVVVNPVRLSSLRDFGTPDFVAEKLLQAERKKESTKSVELVTTREKLGHQNIPIYEIEYKLDSTRGGMKRIFSSAFVYNKKLYLLNIACSDGENNPLNGNRRMVLEQVLHSFDVV